MAGDRRVMAARVLPLIDLTNLDNGCMPADVERLCAAATTPYGSVAAVCVWPAFVAQSVSLLSGTGVRVATVVNFPAGGEVSAATVAETVAAIDDGADEIDVVIPYRAMLRGDTAVVAELVRAVVATAGRSGVVQGATVERSTRPVHVKSILESGELGDAAVIERAARLAIEAGVDFVKTSTGKSPASATIEAARAMLRAVVDADRPVGLKPSGGIRTVEQAAEYLALADEILGPQWATPQTFRFGASSLLGDVLDALAGCEG